MKELKPAILMTLLFVVFCGGLFPLFLWGAGQALFPHQANGSLVKGGEGKIVGSEIIGQAFSDPKYFHPRPSGAGSGYDAASSSGTNLGPISSKLVAGIDDDPATPDTDESYAGIQDLAKAYREENGLPADAKLPADAVTRSGSGLDPHISPGNALLQSARVARARGLGAEEVKTLVLKNVEGRFLGFGEPRVNVLKLNMQLDAAKGSG